MQIYSLQILALLSILGAEREFKRTEVAGRVMEATTQTMEQATGFAHDAHPLAARVLTPDAVDFLVALERRFRARRAELLEARRARQARLDAGELPDFLAETAAVRAGAWKVAPAPAPLVDRRVEITGPTDRKMMINALNSGARVFMADLEDATSPTWSNIVTGQANLQDAARRSLELATPERVYRLGEELATLVVRPRGWHLDERHVVVDGEAMSASLFDAGCHLFHNARALLEAGAGPYLYLPKLEGHLEARLWRDVLCFAEDELGLERGSIRVTVLIETILAAFEMDEILFELRQHACGLNAGRWDYIFSVAKKLGRHERFLLPDRSSVTMTVPFMRAYTELLVATCHRRGAHAIGGMAAFIPNRRKPEVTAEALRKVAEDKRREARDGFDGTWVAHPDLVATARAEFDAVLGERPNQLERTRDDVAVGAADLLAVECPPGGITREGLWRNVSVGIAYLDAWLGGTGAAAIDDLMEDAATAEICRAQVWQWVHHGVVLPDGARVDAPLVRALAAAEVARRTTGDPAADGRLARARAVFEQVALSDDFLPFLTIPAGELLE
ncbi:MAG TPA: malate synthase A [Acidimicrobiales bacterium]|nr:malate synthase A [Acidimicrobiales bacterium]